jgi:hypothetical protein
MLPSYEPNNDVVNIIPTVIAYGYLYGSISISVVVIIISGLGIYLISNVKFVPNNVNMERGGNNYKPTVKKKFPKLNFSCQNVCSLNISKPSKRTHGKLVSVTNCGSNIIFISDTHMNSDKQTAGVNNIIKKLKFLGYSMQHISSKNSRGVAMLLSNKLDFTILDSFRDDSCNILL